MKYPKNKKELKKQEVFAEIRECEKTDPSLEQKYYFRLLDENGDCLCFSQPGEYIEILNKLAKIEKMVTKW